jgi:hypothetical protein
MHAFTMSLPMYAKVIGDQRPAVNAQTAAIEARSW